MHIHPVCEYDALSVLYVIETWRRGRSGSGGFVVANGDQFEVEGGDRGGGGAQDTVLKYYKIFCHQTKRRL